MTMKEELDKEIAATVAALPQVPPPDVMAFPKLDGDILIYRVGFAFLPLENRRRRMAHVHCTACGEEGYLEYINDGAVGFINLSDGKIKYHGDICICPYCGKEVKAIHIRAFRQTYIIDWQTVVSLHNVRGHLAVLSWDFKKEADKDGNVFMSFMRMDGAVFVNRTPVKVAGYQKNISAFTAFPRWKRLMKFSDRLDEIASDHISPFPPETVNESDCEKSGLLEYLASCGDTAYPIKYLQLWCRKPNTENLAKQGLGKYLTKLIKHCNGASGYYYNSVPRLNITDTAKYINWSEAKPAKMLGLEKSEMRIASRYSPATVATYAYMRKCGEKLGEDELAILDGMYDYEIKGITEKPIHGYRIPFAKLLRYIVKQRKWQKSTGRVRLIDRQYILDYWESVYKVYGRLPPDLLYPRDIIASHDNMLLRVKEHESAELNAKMRELDAERERYCFTDDTLGLMIFPCRTHGELIKEGKLLHHCVAGYAKAHADGTTTIFFIRHIDEPDVPFFTLEWRNGRVSQNRGYGNRARTDEVIAFEEKWLNYIKEIKENKENGKCKHGSERIAANAGA